MLRRVCGSTDWVGARAGTRPFPVPPLAVGTEWGLRGTWRRTRGAAEVHFKHASSVPHGNRAVPVQWTRKWRFRSKAPCPGPHSQVGGGAGFACSVSSGWPPGSAAGRCGLSQPSLGVCHWVPWMAGNVQNPVKRQLEKRGRIASESASKSTLSHAAPVPGPGFHTSLPVAELRGVGTREDRPFLSGDPRSGQVGQPCD